MANERRLSSLPDQINDALFEAPVRPPIRLRYPPIEREAVQPLRDIRASGFDAIVQLTGEVMLLAVKRNLPDERTAETRIPADLDIELADQLADVVAAQHVEAPVVAFGPPQGNVQVELEPLLLRASLSPQSVRVTSGEAPAASVRFSMSLNVVAVETDASHRSRVDLASFQQLPPPLRETTPPDSPPVSVEIPVLQTALAAVVSGLVEVDVDQDDYRIDAAIDFSSASVDVRGSRAWDAVTLDLITPLVSEWGSCDLIPSIRLFGDPAERPVLEAVRFDVTTVGLPANTANQTLLSFCVETAEGGTAPDAASVGPFTGAGNFACFATDPVIRGTALSRWASIPVREFEGTVLFELELDGERREASARVRYEIGDAQSAEMVYGAQDLADHVAVSSTVRSRALSARLAGRDISDELGDLAEVREVTEMFLLFPDRSPVEQLSEEVENFLIGIGRHVMLPLVRPISRDWRIQGDYETQVSTANAAMVTRGFLE